MRNPFKKTAREIPDEMSPEEKLRHTIPMREEAVPEAMRGALPLVRALADYCVDHDLSLIGMIVPTIESVESFAMGESNVVNLPIMAGFPVLFPLIHDALAAHVNVCAENALAEMKAEDAANVEGEA